MESILSNPILANQDRFDLNKIMNLIMMFYVFRIVRLILIIVTLSYFLGCFWFFVTWKTSVYYEDSRSDNFYLYKNLDTETDLYNMFAVTYFSFTTLATVGYGDFHPRSDVERILAWFVLLIGVACFSFIMGNFIEILMSYRVITAVNDNSEDLAKWMGLLARYSRSGKLDKKTIEKLENYFDYYWKHDRNYAVRTEVG